MPHGLSKAFFLPFDQQHLANALLYGKQLDAIYAQAIKEAIAIAGKVKSYDPDKPFTFADYPQTRARANKLFTDLVPKIHKTVTDAQSNEWLLANSKNDNMVDALFKKTGIKKSDLSRYYQQNLKALSAFQNRKEGGLKLSDRVWKYTKQFKSEIEMGLDIGLGEGKSAKKLATDMKKYLQKPDKLFRRVRDKRGVLHLSQNAANFHPGQGVYRSSYKNSLRLTRTEANMAYRAADSERWSQLDFVKGIEIRTSHNHKIKDICDELAGKYPKDFKFPGWHPQCYCFAVPILADDDEFDKMQQAILNGDDPGDVSTSGEIKGLPVNFAKWVRENKDKVARAKHKPYFLTDNTDLINGRKKTVPLNPIKIKPEPQKPVSKPKAEPQRYKSIPEAEKAMQSLQITDAQRKALIDYTGGDYNQINGWLREQREAIEQKAENSINVLDDFLTNAPKLESTSYRGITLDTEDDFNAFKKLKKGGYYTDNGFMSTTYEKSVAEEFLGSAQWQVEMTIEGKNGVLIENLSDAKREKEILFNKGSRFKIKSIKSTGKKGMFGKIFITLQEP